MDRNLELQKYVPLFVHCVLAPAARHEVSRSFFYVSSNCACTVAPREARLSQGKPKNRVVFYPLLCMQVLLATERERRPA